MRGAFLVEPVYALCLAGILSSACVAGGEDAASDEPTSLVTTGETGATLGAFGVVESGTVFRPRCYSSEVPTRGRIPVARDNLVGVSIYQGVEVELPLGGGGWRTDVVAGREALIRIFVDPRERLYGAELVIENGAAEPLVLEDQRTLERGSTKGDLGSSYNFVIPDGIIGADTTLSAELYTYGECEGRELPEESATFPAQGSYPLRAREVGPIEIVVVPVRYDTDDSGRLPDVGEEHLAELASHLRALYPVRNVELRVREPISTMETTMEGVLGQLLHLRSLEQPARNVAYFGLVNPAPTMAEYCVGTCVAGVSAVGSPSGEASAGVGIGFRGPAQETFLHELGHMNRLEHAPCGGPSDADSDYPYEGAMLGTWGYDLRERRLIDPQGVARDFMSYCDPTWISDYNFRRLMGHLSLSNALPNADIVSWNSTNRKWQDGERSRFSVDGAASADWQKPEFTMALLTSSGAARLTSGLPERPSGGAVRGAWLDERGAILGYTSVTQLELSEGRGKILYFPTPEKGRAALRLDDGTTVSLVAEE